LGHDGVKEVLACLGGLIVEIEVVVEVRNASIMGIPLEMTYSGGALSIVSQLQNSLAFVTHQRMLFPLPAAIAESTSSTR
jgi:hypothetical protein